MFTTLIVQPIFNLLVLIYALLPGHNFGMAIIIFTIIIRILLWPLLKKQLHHTKAIRALQPEIKKIKQAAKGDRQKQSQLTMELYKERQINPFATLAIVLVQIPILLGLFFGIQKIVKDPQQIVDFSYSFIQSIGNIEELAHDISKFDSTLFGLVDLTQPAFGPNGLYFPALVLVAAAAAVQFFQSKQLMPQDKEARGLRAILKDAGKGNSADQQEVSAAMGRNMLFLIPAFVFIFGLSFPAALPLYWFVSSAVAYFQQSRILKEDVEEATEIANQSSAAPKEKESAIAKSKTKKKPSKKRSKNTRSRRRRK